MPPGCGCGRFLDDFNWPSSWGVVPLVASTGAGADIASLRMGIAVFSGMLGVTVFGLLLDAASSMSWCGKAFARVPRRTRLPGRGPPLQSTP